MRGEFTKESLALINPYMQDAGSFVEGMFLTDVIDAGSKKPKWSKYYSEYVIETHFNVFDLQRFYMDFLEQEKVIVLIPETRYFSGERKKPFDVKTKGVFNDVEIEDLGVCASIRLKLHEQVGVRYFLKGLFPGLSTKKLNKFSIRKENLFVEERLNSFSKVEFDE